jgi:hypothetical protein
MLKMSSVTLIRERLSSRARTYVWGRGASQLFEMVLSPRVPGMIRRALKAAVNEILSDAPATSIDLWAVHPGGTSVIDAVQRALDLKPEALADSRDVLRRYGNMSSATVMFVLEHATESTTKSIQRFFVPELVMEVISTSSIRPNVSIVLINMLSDIFDILHTSSSKAGPDAYGTRRRVRPSVGLL